MGDAYRLERELGGGGMSRVFEAEERRLKRRVAIKVLSPGLAEGISLERFEREIQTAAALQQANIVPVLSAGDTNGLPFYTMPFVDGESLRARLARGPLPVAEVIGILRDVAKALAYAHRMGVVHRDIKPDNVLLSEGTAVVTDFGIAKALSAARTSTAGATLTQVGTSIGTPAYMAPEQAAGDPDVDHRADIYSLGAMAYELLAGRPVFADRTAQRMLAAHMTEPPQSIGDVRGDVPAPLAELVMRCLAKEPDNRPQSASEIVRVLETFTSGGGMESMPAVLIGGPRMLGKALGLYAAAFVGVAIVAKAAIVGIGLPDWVFPGSLIVMALGLPVILWTGYVQRVTRRALTATPTFTPGGTPQATQGTIATMALRAAPHMSWYRTAKSGAIALGGFALIVAAFMAMRGLGVGPFASLLAAGKLTSREPLLITDFAVTNVDSALGRVVSDAVRAGLSQSSVITLLPPVATASALRMMERPPLARVDLPLARQLAQRLGVKAIVDGDVTGVTGGYIVALRLVTADSGVELWSGRETGDGPRGLIDASDRLARALRGKAGESLRAVHGTAALEQVTTTSLDALRLYSEGARYHDILSDWPNAIMRFREAVALDSNFAMAWRKLGAALGNAGRPHAEVDAALEAAHRHRDHLTENERDFEEAFYYLRGPGGDRAKGIALYEGLVRRGDASVAGNLALEYLGRREFVKAESTEALSIREYPEQGLSWYEIAWAQGDQGHWDAVAPGLRAAEARFPDNSLRPIVHAYLLYHAGLLDSLQRYLDSIRDHGRPDMRITALTESAELALVRGHLSRALGVYAQAAAANSAAGTASNVVADSAAVTRMEVATLGPSAAAADRLDRVLARSPLRTMDVSDRPYFSVATAYARAGRADRARAILADYDREVHDTAVRRSQQPALHTAQAELALAENRAADAIREFRRGDSAPDGPASMCVLCLPVNLARAFDAAHESDSAISMYERYLTTPAIDRLDAPLFMDFADPLDPLYLANVYYRLGELYEAKGDAANAARNYRAFVDLWQDADAPLQPRVAEARRRLAALAFSERAKR